MDHFLHHFKSGTHPFYWLNCVSISHPNSLSKYLEFLVTYPFTLYHVSLQHCHLLKEIQSLGIFSNVWSHALKTSVLKQKDNSLGWLVSLKETKWTIVVWIATKWKVHMKLKNRQNQEKNHSKTVLYYKDQYLIVFAKLHDSLFSIKWSYILKINLECNTYN